MAEIKIKINTPFMQLEMEGDKKNIVELRKMFAEINKMSMSDLDFNFDDMPSMTLPFWKFSKEIQKNTKMMDLINQVSQVEDGLIVRKESVDNISEINDNGTVYTLGLQDTKKLVKNLLDEVDVAKTSFALIHVMGDLSDDSYSIIFDQIKRQIPHSKTEVLKTKKNILGKTVVECLFFGKYPVEE